MATDVEYSDEEIYVELDDTYVKLEAYLLEFDVVIKSCLQRSSAKIDLAIELMNCYKELKITKCMLLKNYTVVQTMMRLRKYVGNKGDWGFTNEQNEEFDEKAAIVRNLAETMYKSFESLFVVPEGRTFSDILNEEIQLFKERVSHLTPDELKYYNEDEEDDEDDEDDYKIPSISRQIKSEPESE